MFTKSKKIRESIKIDIFTNIVDNIKQNHE